METKNKLGKIVLLIFLLICSGLGIAAFIMSFTKKCGKGFKEVGKPDNDQWLSCSETMVGSGGSIFCLADVQGGDATWSGCTKVSCQP